MERTTARYRLVITTSVILSLWLGVFAAEQVSPTAGTPAPPSPIQEVPGPPDPALTAERILQLMSTEAIAWPRPVIKEPAKPLPMPDTKSATSVLVETAQSEDPATRLRGLEGFAQTGSVEYVDAFIAALSDPVLEIRDLAVQALVRLDNGIVFEKIMAILGSGNGDAVVKIDAVLPDLRDALEPGMLRVLSAPDEPGPRKQVAAYALGRMNSVRAVPVLMTGIWTSEAEPDVAVACARALAAIRDPAIGPALVDLIRHSLQSVRWVALQGLADLGGPEALDALQRVAIEPPEGDTELGRQAVSDLAASKKEMAVPLLIEVMRRNLSLRRAAVEALHQLTGEDLGDRPSDWQTWYEQKQQEAQRPPDQVPPAPPWEIEYLPE